MLGKKQPRRNHSLVAAMTSRSETIAIDKIRRDGGTQSRPELNDEHVARLIDALERGKQLPPVEAIYDGSDYWLYDGFHRVAATETITSVITANVTQGTQRDAIRLSLSVNTDHGLPRSNPAKRAAVKRALLDEEWSGWSNRKIAKLCSVSDSFVRSVKREMTALNPTAFETQLTRYERNGRVQVMDTSNIGKMLVTPPPATIAQLRAAINQFIEPRSKTSGERYDLASKLFEQHHANSASGIYVSLIQELPKPYTSDDLSSALRNTIQILAQQVSGAEWSARQATVEEVAGDWLYTTMVLSGEVVVTRYTVTERTESLLSVVGEDREPFAVPVDDVNKNYYFDSVEAAKRYEVELRASEIERLRAEIALYQGA